MAITIKELLAADTISQAADKINFNFDQLLLNGGGPVGPLGPLGPPGPIGGRGIRGSQWFDGSLEPTDPSIIFPPLHQHDMYLEGPINSFQTGDGDVWEYNGAAWLWTGINLKGDQGTPGVSDDWGKFGGALLFGEENLYPVQEPSIVNEVRSVSIGGIPNGIWVGAPSNYEIDQDLAKTMDSTSSSLWIHTADDTVSAIKFSGGDTLGDYSINYTQLSSIGLSEGDSLVLQDNRDGLAPSDPGNAIGLRLKSENRDVLVEAGRGFSITTGNNFGPAPVYTTQSSIELKILANATGTSDAEIILNNQIASERAIFKVGTGDTYAGTGFVPGGNITARSYSHYIETAQQFGVRSYAAGIGVQINANSGSISISSGLTTTIGGTDVNIYALATGGTVNLKSKADLSIESDNADINLTAGAKFHSDTGGNVEFDIDGTNGDLYIYSSGTQPNVGIGYDPSFPLNNARLCVNDRVAIGVNSNTQSVPVPNSLWVQENLAVGMTNVPWATVGIQDTDETISLYVVGSNYAGSSSTYGTYIINARPTSGTNAEKYGTYTWIKDDPALGATRSRFGHKINCDIILDSGITANKGDSFGLWIDTEQQGLISDNIIYGIRNNVKTNSVDDSLKGLAIRTSTTTPSSSLAAHRAIEFTMTHPTSNAYIYGIKGSVEGGLNTVGIEIDLQNGNGFPRGINITGDIYQNKIQGSIMLGSNGYLYSSTATVNIVADNTGLQTSVGKYALSVVHASPTINTTTGGGVSINTRAWPVGADARALVVATQNMLPDTWSPSGPTQPNSWYPLTVYGDGSVWLGGEAAVTSSGDDRSQVCVRFGTNWFQLRRNTGLSYYAYAVPITSDQKYKHNVQPIHDHLSKVLSLEPISYEWNEDFKDLQVDKSGIIADKNSEAVKEIRKSCEGTEVGFIAQAVKEIIPEIVYENENEGLSISYNKLTTFLVGAIKEQQTTIKNLEARLQRLEEKS